MAENIANNSAETNPDKSSLEFLYKDYVEDVFALDPNTIYVQSSIPQNPDDIDELHFKIEEFPELNSRSVCLIAYCSNYIQMLHLMKALIIH